ncbi:hypothetical protein DIC82_15315 [Clostridium beijerinckii]|nr:hypothetical protein DIC82_15315 [Clostridium beijerinckii]
MVNIFSDTNIFISLMTSLDDNKLFEDLKIMIEEGIVKLLVPEIVILELEKHINYGHEYLVENELEIKTTEDNLDIFIDDNINAEANINYIKKDFLINQLILKVN